MVEALNMRWKQKAAIQRLLSSTPGGSSVNYLLQRLVRRSGRLDDSSFLFRARTAIAHLDAALAHLTRPASSLSVYEFGAGSDLVGPLALRARGVPSQVLIDQAVLLRPSLVAEAFRRFQRNGSTLSLPPLPELPTGSRRQLIHALRERMGIEYRAPVDATRTGLKTNSVDLITSNSTLEHVPSANLQPLLKECRRLLRDDGIMCFRIDYEDHYAILDRALSPYNFLRYSDRKWRRYNSSLQFQNRLRHRDYLRLFAEAGLLALSVETLEPSEQSLAELTNMPIAEQFRSYTTAELGTRKGTFLLRKAPG